MIATISPFSSVAALSATGGINPLAPVGGAPSLLAQPGIPDTFTRTQPQARPIRNVVVWDVFNTDATGFNHGQSMVNTLRSGNPNLQLQTVDMSTGGTPQSVARNLLTASSQLLQSGQPLPDAINLSMVMFDRNSPELPQIQANLKALADRGVKIFIPEGKIQDANGRNTNTSARNAGDHMVKNLLAIDHPNITTVSASGEQIAGADVTSTGRTASFATASALAQASLQAPTAPVVTAPTSAIGGTGGGLSQPGQLQATGTPAVAPGSMQDLLQMCMRIGCMIMDMMMGKQPAL